MVGSVDETVSPVDMVVDDWCADDVIIECAADVIIVAACEFVEIMVGVCALSVAAASAAGVFATSEDDTMPTIFGMLDGDAMLTMFDGDATFTIFGMFDETVDIFATLGSVWGICGSADMIAGTAFLGRGTRGCVGAVGGTRLL